MMKYGEGISSFEVLSWEFSGLSAQVPFCWQHAATVTSLQQWNPIAFCPLLQIARYDTMYKWPPSIQEGDTPNQTWLTPRCLIVEIFSYSSLLYIPLTNGNARLFFCAFHVVLYFASSRHYSNTGSPIAGQATKGEQNSLIFTVIPCILILSKSFIYQLMHNRVALKEY